MDIEKSIKRIIRVIDGKVNNTYGYNEPNIPKVAEAYIRKYLTITSPEFPSSKLRLLCTTSYLIALKYLLDSYPAMKDYSRIVNTSSKSIVGKELEIAKKFLFNFTPKL